MAHKLHQPSPLADAPRCVTARGAHIADVAAYLRSALPTAWQVEEHIDPAGELSLVVLATDDDPALPTFLLHDRALVPHVATIADDVWEADRAFALWPEAAEAIVAMTLAISPGRRDQGRRPQAPRDQRRGITPSRHPGLGGQSVLRTAI